MELGREPCVLHGVRSPGLLEKEGAEEICREKDICHGVPGEANPKQRPQGALWKVSMWEGLLCPAALASTLSPSPTPYFFITVPRCCPILPIVMALSITQSTAIKRMLLSSNPALLWLPSSANNHKVADFSFCACMFPCLPLY